MDAGLAFLAGIVVGAGLVLALEMNRRRPALRPRDGTRTVSAPCQVELLPRAGGRTTRRVTMQTVVRIQHGQVAIEVDGTPYVSLADVPEADREMVLAELRMIRGSGELSDAGGVQLDAFLAAPGPGDEV